MCCPPTRSRPCSRRRFRDRKIIIPASRLRGRRGREDTDKCGGKPGAWRKDAGRRGASSGEGRLLSPWGWVRRPHPLTMSGNSALLELLSPQGGQTPKTPVGVLRPHTAQISRPHAFSSLPGNLHGQPWPHTAKGLSFEEEPPPARVGSKAVSSLCPALCDLGPHPSYP